VMNCGKARVWLDPTEANEISLANSRQSIRKLVKDGFIIRKPIKGHSRFRARKYAAEKAKGRHKGPGRRQGTRNARMPQKELWMARLRVLRRVLAKYREQKEIDSHIYRNLYLKAKGNVFRNKRLLLEAIHKIKDDRAKEAQLRDQLKARKTYKTRAEREAIKAAEKLAVEKGVKREKPEAAKKEAKKDAKKEVKKEQPEKKAKTEKPKEEKKPSEKKAAEKKPAEKAPAEKKPAEKKPAEKKAAEKKPAEKKSAEKKSAEKKPAEKKPAEKKEKKAPK